MITKTTVNRDGVGITIDVANIAEASAKELWTMLDEVTSLDSDDLYEYFGCEYSGDLISDYTYEEFVDMYKQFKKREAEIRVGDEVEWNRSAAYVDEDYLVRAIVIEVTDIGYGLLIYSPIRGYHEMMVSKNENLTKTGVRLTGLAHDLAKK